VPVTPFGYVIGGMCALCGLIFMALPIPVIVNNFTTFYAHAKARQQLKKYTQIQKSLQTKVIARHFDSRDYKNSIVDSNDKLDGMFKNKSLSLEN
jgi:hypothetical protein